MCGIVGAIANRNVTPLLLNGLKKLEYRGYDSAGIAILNSAHELELLRVVGKVDELQQAMNTHSLSGYIGIAHTRWATHGAPLEKNAHPFHSHHEFALVHNGVIENHAILRDELIKAHYTFESDTDTEVIVHLLHHYYGQTKNLLSAVAQTVARLNGAYALGIISKHHPDRLIAVRQGSPLVIGIGQGENYIASDPLALLSETRQFIYLEDNDIADVSLNRVSIYNRALEPIERKISHLALQHTTVERGEYRHFMQKEIMEQDKALAACLEDRIVNHHVLPAIFGPLSQDIFKQVEHVHLVACGTSYHAALVARYWIESHANIPCAVEVASEFRYRDIAATKNSLMVVLSQSGETADTLAALRLAKKLNYLSTLAITNVPESTIVREAELNFLTRAGIEIGVASTKAFLTQLIALLLLTVSLKKEKIAEESDHTNLMAELEQLPELIRKLFQKDAQIAAWAKLFTDKQHAIFIGRSVLYPIALEGALKMKEISYIHAEGYPGGELKHGPLALVDSKMPVIAMAPSNLLFEKSLSNLQVILARGGQLIVLTDDEAYFNKDVFSGSFIFKMPKISPMLAPILYTIPLQMLAYHVAVLKGTDVDQPRNLAKSVTVE